MLSKQGVTLEIKETPQGAWISHNAARVGLSLRSDLQFFYINNDSRGSEAVIYFWDYKTFINGIVRPLNIEYKQLSRENVLELIRLHDKLIEANISEEVLIILKAQKKAGVKQYAPINDKIAAAFDRYLLKDLQNYRMAGALLHFVLTFASPQPTGFRNFREFILDTQMKNWQGLIMSDKQAYHALNKTLQKWRGAVPQMIFNLGKVRLERPLPVHNALLLCALEDNRFEGEIKLKMRHLIQHTPADDILMLLKMPQIVHQDRMSRYEALLSYIFDGMRMENESYPTKKLIAMWNRSYKAHMNEQRRREFARLREGEARRAGQKEWMATETKKPPIDLPEEFEDGVLVRFLDTVDAVHCEGDLMAHCIASYSGSAVSGDCYLFHIDFHGEMASAEVTRDGKVNQIRGPHNSRNAACNFAAEFLNHWVGTWASAKKKKKNLKSLEATNI